MITFATGVKPVERFGFAAAILEHFEQGASRHCLELIRNAVGEIVYVRHHRLGISVSFA